MTPPPAVFYLIPGLGADERVFQFLRLRGEVHVLRWLAPQSPDESLVHYATHLAAATPVAQACWLVGISFGGVLALEVGALRPLARVVLLSSFASPAELPWAVRLARTTGLYRLLPPQLVPRVAQWFFGVENGSEYQLLKQIIADTDLPFMRWAIAQLLHWSGRPLGPVVRIHGTADRLLPAGAELSEYHLPGGHFIVVSRAAEISQILNQLAAGEETELKSGPSC